MNRTIGFGAALLAALALLVVTAREARTQIVVAPAFVRLQATTPGIAQNGNANLTGTIISGALSTGAFKLSTGAAAGKVLASNAAGNGSWQPDGLTLPYTGASASNGFSSFDVTNTIGPAISGSSSGDYAGVNGFTSGTSGYAVFGRATSATGVTRGAWLQSLSTSGIGAEGEATATTGTTTGVYGTSASPTGIGVYGVCSAASGGTDGKFESNGTNGVGVRSQGTFYGVVATTTNGTGVSGLSINATGVGGSSTSGDGVYGSSNAGNGVTGETSGTNAFGVVGNAYAATGGTRGVYGRSDSSNGIGVYGFSNNATFGYGVVGGATNTNGWAVFANGNSGGTGTKSFRIDHPSDPLHKYLVHYSSESPMPQNFYLGNTVTDAKGYAWVELPDYFQDINTNFKYQLTVVDDADTGGFVLAKVSKKIQGHRFQIRTSAPHVEVSWEVKADRNDRYVRVMKPKDVIEKEGLERGTYEMPELYGQPASRGTFYQTKDVAGPGGKALGP